MSIEQFVQKNKRFWWYVKKPDQLDKKAIVEGAIKYGDMKEIKQLMNILGSKNVAKIFAGQISQRRLNYDDRTVNYFKQYFKKYAK